MIDSGEEPDSSIICVCVDLLKPECLRNVGWVRRLRCNPPFPRVGSKLPTLPLLWRASLHPEFQISVNKSPVQFHNEKQSHQEWYDLLRQLGLPGQSIVVEITEGLLLDAGTLVTDRLLEFRDAGIQVSLDDFGTGYSALAYLKKFDIDYLKIDQSFTHNLAPGSDDMALCEAIIVMAHKLGIQVIAEGVETEKQKDLLTAAGCDYAQGYLFSRPVPAEEFEKLLQKV